MTKLKVPSLQHLARNWRETPEKIKNKLVGLANGAPPFNYNMLFDLMPEIIGRQPKPPKELFEDCIRRKQKHPQFRDDFIEIINLAYTHFNNIEPKFVHAVESRMYPIGRGLKVPFTPPLIYGNSNLEIYFPWFSFWKDNPLSDEPLSLFVTIVYELLNQDPVLENAEFIILDFSVPNKTVRSRELNVIHAKEIPILTDARKQDMLEIFAEGYALAVSALAEQNEKPESMKEDAEIQNTNQIVMHFDE